MKKLGEYTLEVMNKADWYNNWLFGRIETHIKGDILEAGAGIGNFTGFLLKRGNVTAIDLEKSYLSNLKKSFGKELFAGYGNIENGRYFFKQKKFDSIVCMNVLEHIEDDKQALKNMSKLLNKGGKLILLVPAHMMLFSAFDKLIGHFRRYTKDNLTAKVELVGMSVVSCKYLNWFAAIGWYISMKVLAKKSLPQMNLNIFNKIGRVMLFPEAYIGPPFGLSVLLVAERK